GKGPITRRTPASHARLCRAAPAVCSSPRAPGSAAPGRQASPPAGGPSGGLGVIPQAVPPRRRGGEASSHAACPDLWRVEQARGRASVAMFGYVLQKHGHSEPVLLVLPLASPTAPGAAGPGSAEPLRVRRWLPRLARGRAMRAAAAGARRAEGGQGLGRGLPGLFRDAPSP
ncbi:unnamed protein product, partial [Prorocentrum cordatum]